MCGGHAAVIKPIFTSIIAVSLLFGSVSAEDVFTVTTDDVVAACAADTDTCLAAVRAHLAALDAATIDQAVADLVVALASSPAARDVTVAAIREAARFSGDPAQASRIAEIAATIAAGDVGATAAIAEIPGSPA
jgi:hypothetical protein